MLPSFEPIPSVTRRDHVAAALRKSILAGHISPGTQLVESGLAAQFGVSRGLLREAIRELIETGLVMNRPYAGTFVTKINGQILRDVYDLRRVIERQAYVTIWPRRDASFFNELQSRFDAMVDAVRRDNLNEEIQTEAHFHGLVYERCGNHLMPGLWQQLTQKIQMGFAICQISHAPKIDFEDNHHKFLHLALGHDLNALLEELDIHLDRGLATIEFSSSGKMAAAPAPSFVTAV